MKPYGHVRVETANRNRRGTSRPCPCCTPPEAKYNRAKRARREGKLQAQES